MPKSNSINKRCKKWHFYYGKISQITTSAQLWTTNSLQGTHTHTWTGKTHTQTHTQQCTDKHTPCGLKKWQLVSRHSFSSYSLQPALNYSSGGWGGGGDGGGAVSVKEKLKNWPSPPPAPARVIQFSRIFFDFCSRSLNRLILHVYIVLVEVSVWTQIGQFYYIYKILNFLKVLF